MKAQVYAPVATNDAVDDDSALEMATLDHANDPSAPLGADAGLALPSGAPGAADAAAAPGGDPATCLCRAARVPRIGTSRQYVLWRPPPALSAQCAVATVGPHWAGLLVTAALVVGASAGFVTRVASRIALAPAAFSAVALAWTAVTLAGLLLTGCADPGVVSAAAARECAAEAGAATAAAAAGEAAAPRARYCEPCAMFQPPTATHCEDCAACIDGLDHHCPWMGKCIGRGNLRYFRLFNWSWLTYSLYMCVCIALKEGGVGS